MNFSPLHKPVILFFIENSSPTPAETVEALSYDATVRFRNARYAKDDNTVEPCDGVACIIPKAYEGKASAKEAVESYKAKLSEISAQLGDVKAPVTKVEEIKAKPVTKEVWGK